MQPALPCPEPNFALFQSSFIPWAECNRLQSISAIPIAMKFQSSFIPWAECNPPVGNVARVAMEVSILIHPLG